MPGRPIANDSRLAKSLAMHNKRLQRCLLIALAAAAPAAGQAPPQSRPASRLQDAVQRPEPFAGSLLKTNPPAFRWPEAAGAFEVEIAGTRTLRGATRVEVRETFYRPLNPLPPGRYWWRYRTTLRLRLPEETTGRVNAWNPWGR